MFSSAFPPPAAPAAHFKPFYPTCPGSSPIETWRYPSTFGVRYTPPLSTASFVALSASPVKLAFKNQAGMTILTENFVAPILYDRAKSEL